ncbi:hypothetical protein [Mycetocola miduiensis]|uniref:DUF8129 domain-containing protein n=1 Tax=Mycetocola miduiensis TaxID=995034 RepID=A0A1I5C4L8_9MICO|nr:hypothetical protein [Mycetocola miduiensis]SFN81945.1 hypothetical protein SAMN05216219_2207 [Mycetocola miduiensis]
MSASMIFADFSAAGGHAPDQHFHAESLDVEGLLALLAYEKAHGNRVAIMQALTERLAAVRSGVEPTGPLGAHLPPTFVA